jgi:nucleoside-diphosphate-sugar epimerase
VTQESTGGVSPKEIFRGSIPALGGFGRAYISPHTFFVALKYFTAEWYVDMTDVARIHLAAAFDATVFGERFIAAADKFNWNELIDTVRRIAPDAKVAKHLPEPIDKDLGENDNNPGADLLAKWFGQSGYTGLEETIRRHLEGDV